jgi:AraC family transcriptional regulator
MRIDCPFCRKLRARAVTFHQSHPVKHTVMPSCAAGHSGVWDNTVIWIKARDVEFPQHNSALSIKCVFHGSEVFEVESRRHTVSQNSFLVLNHGQKYFSAIRTEVEADTLAVFLDRGFVRDVVRSLTSNPSHLLDKPTTASTQSVNFFEKLYAYEPGIFEQLLKLRAQLQSEKNEAPSWWEEQLCGLTEKLLQTQKVVRLEMDNLLCVRQSTRLELYRRLDRARQFINDNLHEPLSLTQMADVACLSLNHFLRQFRALYKQTPHQYLREKRLERAQDLLLNTSLPITEVSFQVGFESPSTFSWLVRRKLGLSPEKFRKERAKR